MLLFLLPEFSPELSSSMGGSEMNLKVKKMIFRFKQVILLQSQALKN